MPLAKSQQELLRREHGPRGLREGGAELLEAAGLRCTEERGRCDPFLVTDPSKRIGLGERPVLGVELTHDEGLEDRPVASFADLEHVRIGRTAHLDDFPVDRERLPHVTTQRRRALVVQPFQVQVLDIAGDVRRVTPRVDGRGAPTR